MHGQGHARRLLRHHFVDESGVAVGQLVGVVATGTGGFAHFVVAQIGQVGVVHLHIVATRRRQRAQLIAIGFGNVVVKSRVEFRIGVFADASATTTEMQHGGRGDGHLGRTALGNLRLQVIEVGQLDVFHMAYFVDHTDDGWGQFLGAIRTFNGDGDVGFHAAHLLQEVNMKIGAAEFAIGDGLQAHILLELHNFRDGFVFHHAQLLGGDLTLGFLFTGF